MASAPAPPAANACVGGSFTCKLPRSSGAPLPQSLTCDEPGVIQGGRQVRPRDSDRGTYEGAARAGRCAAIRAHAGTNETLCSTPLHCGQKVMEYFIGMVNTRMERMHMTWLLSSPAHTRPCPEMLLAGQWGGQTGPAAAVAAAVPPDLPPTSQHDARPEKTKKQGAGCMLGRITSREHVSSGPAAAGAPA